MFIFSSAGVPVGARWSYCPSIVSVSVPGALGFARSIRQASPLGAGGAWRTMSSRSAVSGSTSSGLRSRSLPRWIFRVKSVRGSDSLLRVGGEDRLEGVGQVDRAVLPALDVHRGLVQGQRAVIWPVEEELPDAPVERGARGVDDAVPLGVEELDPRHPGGAEPGEVDRADLDPGRGQEFVGLRDREATHGGDLDRPGERDDRARDDEEDDRQDRPDFPTAALGLRGCVGHETGTPERYDVIPFSKGGLDRPQTLHLPSGLFVVTAEGHGSGRDRADGRRPRRSRACLSPPAATRALRIFGNFRVRLHLSISES